MGNRESTCLARGCRESGRVLEAAEEVRLREDHGRCVDGSRGDALGIGDATLVGDLDHLEAEPGRIGLDDLAYLRVERLGEHDAGTPGGVLRDEASVRRHREAVVAGRIRDVHPGQLADRRLVLEDRLQDALAHLRLVRRISRQELAPLEDRVDDRRHVVVVDARAEEGELDARVRVLRGELFEVAHELRLAEGGRHVQVTGEANVLRDLVEQVVDRRHADRGEHLVAVAVGEREVPVGHCSATTAWYATTSRRSLTSVGSVSRMRTSQPSP